MSKTSVKVIQATKIYNQKKPNQITPVRDVSLRVPEGCVTVLSGPSGAGKTTLLSMIGCQVKPTSGEIILKDKRISKMSEKMANTYKRKHIGFVFQHFHLLPSLSVLDNIALPLLPLGINKRTCQERVGVLLQKFDLVDRRHFPVKKLSGGEQQRTAIARALINGGTIVLADEPTAHLDSHLSAEFMSIMKQLKKSNYTIVIASHDRTIAENQIVDQLIEIKDGEIV